MRAKAKDALKGLGYAFLVASFTIALAFGAAALFGESELEKATARNGRISAAGSEAQRCVQELPLNPKLLDRDEEVRTKAFRQREADIRKCYQKFNRLTP